MTLAELLEEVAELPEFIGLTVDSVATRGYSLCTPLHCVVNWPDTEALQILLDAGGEVNAVDEMGCTALHFAAGRKNHAAIALLTERGANWNLHNRFGFTPKDSFLGVETPSWSDEQRRAWEEDDRE
jgi:26S proteasome non-ATPase regulatory subunit 10